MSKKTESDQPQEAAEPRERAESGVDFADSMRPSRTVAARAQDALPDLFSRADAEEIPDPFENPIFFQNERPADREQQAKILKALRELTRKKTARAAGTARKDSDHPDPGPEAA